MKKRLLSLCTVLALCLSLLPTSVLAAIAPVAEGTAYESNQTVELDGKPVSFKMYALRSEGGVTNYIRLRDLAVMLDGTAAQFNVKWDGSILLEAGKPYTDRDGSENHITYSGDQPYRKNSAAIRVNGKSADFSAFTLNGGRSTYFQLRELADALGFVADWSKERGVYIETGGASSGDEVAKAAGLGLVPDGLERNLEKQITYAEFCAMLDRFVSLARPDRRAAWEKASAPYHSAGDAMSRVEGALVMLYAAESAGVDTAGYQSCFVELERLFKGEDFYAFPSLNFPLLPNILDRYYNQTLAGSDCAWRCDGPYVNNAVWFVEYRSRGNGKTYFDYDQRYSLNLAKPFTRGDAIRAVERMYENVLFFTYEPVNGLRTTLSADTLARAAAMPEATASRLPAWKGYTIQNRVETERCGIGVNYDKAEVETLASLGFDFVRVPLDFSLIFPGTDTTRANPAFLKNMDNLLAWCAEKGIHVCFDLHDMPGFTTDADDSNDILFFNQATQDLFIDFWRVLATYFKDVPSGLLSFNLLNEPHDAQGPNGNIALTDEVYSAVMRRAVEAIRKITPDRLIFVDTLDPLKGIPVRGLSDARVVQTIHPYFLKEAADSWPSCVIHGFVSRDNGTLTLAGSFPAGTKITVDIRDTHRTSTFTLQADGTAVDSFQLGGDPVGKNGCRELNQAGTSGEWRRYEGRSYTFTLPKSGSELKLVQSGGGSWYQISHLSVDTGKWKTRIASNNLVVENDRDVPQLRFDETGAVSARKADTLAVQSKAWLEEKFRSYQKFTQETGVLFMVQEFGFPASIPSSVAVAAAEDFLSAADEYGIPWCSWTDGFGPLLDSRAIAWRDLMGRGGVQTREGAACERLSENWLLDTSLMKVYQRHMGK